MRIITIACWIIAALALSGVAIWFLTGTVFGIGAGKIDSGWDFGIGISGLEILSGPYVAVGSYSPGASGIDSLDIDWIAGDVTILPHDGDSFKITEFAQRQLKENEKLIIGTSGGTLTIKYCENNRIIKMPQKKLEVLIPRTLSENLNKLSADAASSGISIDNISADILTANTVSGAIRISGSSSLTFNVDSASGSLTIERVGAQDMKFNTVSGAVRISDSSATSLDGDTASGSINVSGTFQSTKFNSISGRVSLSNSASHSILESDSASGAVEISGAYENVSINSVSGSITIVSSSVPDVLKADTTSGGISITVPNEGSITVHHSSVSGSFSSDIPVVIQNRDAQFVLSSISGSIKIFELG
jgi:DUF4097 and DUF4098 domain-containing protein YvlB